MSSKSTSGMTGRHLLWRFVRFDCVFNPPSQLLAEYFLSVLQIDIRHDGPSFVATCRSNRVESIRVDSTTSSTPYRRYLQIDFRYAFPCRKRWFLRPPVSQHHLAANRLPVWRFAAVWVYGSTLYFFIQLFWRVNGLFSFLPYSIF